MRFMSIIMLLCFLAGCVDKTITEPPKHKELTAQEIKNNLKKGDFRAKLEARKQLDKLPLEEKMKLLLELVVDEEASTRILAVRELGKLDDARATEAIQKAATSDADETVKSVAQEALEAQKLRKEQPESQQTNP